MSAIVAILLTLSDGEDPRFVALLAGARETLGTDVSPTILPEVNDLVTKGQSKPGVWTVSVQFGEQSAQLVGCAILVIPEPGTTPAAECKTHLFRFEPSDSARARGRAVGIALAALMPTVPVPGVVTVPAEPKKVVEPPKLTNPPAKPKNPVAGGLQTGELRAELWTTASRSITARQYTIGLETTVGWFEAPLWLHLVGVWRQGSLVNGNQRSIGFGSGLGLPIEMGTSHFTIEPRLDVRLLSLRVSIHDETHSRWTPALATRVLVNYRLHRHFQIGIALGLESTLGRTNIVVGNTVTERLGPIEVTSAIVFSER